MSVRIITTEDGSHSLYNEQLNETYHSTRGAIGESMHVFIKEGLAYWLSKDQKKEVCILEIGFGTGLNAFLTANWAKRTSQKIHFTSLEPFPISSEIYENLNYFDSEEEKVLLHYLHESEWNNEIQISENLKLYKNTSRLEDFTSNEIFDIVYFDAFAPSKQPEVWSLENLRKCYFLLEKGGVLTTYSAQGQFKRNLSEAGFEVQTLPGAMGKKEMVRAIKS